MAVMVLTDSRGRGLQHIIERLTEIEVGVQVMSGAGSELAAIRALTQVREIKPALIILATGICDLTFRDTSTRKTSLRYSTVEECVEGVIGGIKAACEILEVMGKVKISVATLTGLDLVDYNCRYRKHMNEGEYENYCKERKRECKEQKILNEAIIEINRKITVINRNHGTPSTWLSTVVHSYYRKTHHHSYKRLQDGCHPGEATKLKWAKLIVKSLHHILGGKGEDRSITHKI